MRSITAVVVTDKSGGVRFNRRRQSRDRELIADLCRKTPGDVYVTEESAELFADFADRIRVVADPLAECPSGGCAFVEGTPLAPYLSEISTLVVYSWGEDYPTDTYFDIDPAAEGFRQVARYKFQGYSHQKIVKGVYQK